MISSLLALASNYLCPLCQQDLIFADKSFVCLNKHRFDQAKEGYVNLLPVQHKHSKDPGDNNSMVNARRAFLNKGFYQPLITKLTELYHQYGDINQPVLDAGCGEGYYTHQHKLVSNQVYGVDIAKNAIKIAAKRYHDCFFSVGTLAQLPFRNDFFGWVYSIYAPILATEFKRVLNTGGYLVTVTPAENHLYELKELIYRQPKKHDTSKNSIEKLNLLATQRVHYQMQFDQSDDIINLLAMTPFAFKSSEKLILNLKEKSTFNCQADFLIRVYQK